MYSAYGDFINNQLIIENFKNNKKKSSFKPVSRNIIFRMSAINQDNKLIIIDTPVQINKLYNSINMYEYLPNNVKQIIEINIYFNIKNFSYNPRTFIVKTNKEVDVTFEYQNNQYNNYLNYKNKKITINKDMSKFDYTVRIPYSTFPNITKCNITIKPNILYIGTKPVIIINNLKTAIGDIIV
jgi:hypothetical protein